ncbi:protein LIKE COV 1-like [Canna indica]|uniref:Protein LIKE COV 1-like n=1 Tax=Canna indica TaxID=4628 RepID=A0AAQ3JZK9_9LILI|nr:protein LIKE COV 1-like [Canna indica]
MRDLTRLDVVLLPIPPPRKHHSSPSFARAIASGGGVGTRVFHFHSRYQTARGRDRIEWTMGDENSSSPLGKRGDDCELLIPVAQNGPDAKAASSSSAHHHHAGKEASYKVFRSWASKKFMTGCVILFPIAITFYITWWFIHFVDGFFSPIYTQLGINIFGLGFVTSIMFIFLVGVFMSSWLGASILSLGEWFIKRMPFVRHIYNASKQIGSAVSPDQNKQAFKEVVIIRHPRLGEYAFGFITSTVTLQSYTGEEELSCVYVPTNHLYVGDIFLVSSNDIIRPNLSVREGIEIVVSGGMSMPQILTTLDMHKVPLDRVRSTRNYP